jgi:hypothetical protein
MARKQLGLVEEEILILRDQIVEHLNKNMQLGKVSGREVVELAIKELHKSYFGDKSPSVKDRYGAK